MKIVSSFLTLPRWYLITFGVVFFCYLGGWFYTIHIAAIERAAGAAYVMPVGPHDSSSYAALSDALLQGHFSEGAEQYEYFHTPGYPAFVAAIRFVTGGSYFAVTFIQVLLVFATALMTFVLGSILVSEKVGLWASLLFLANPLVPSIAFLIATDTLFMFLLTLGFLLIVKYAREHMAQATFAAAVCFALAIYVRPVGFVAFPIFIAPLLAFALPLKKKVYAGAAMLLVIAVILVPWMLRNKAHSGVFSFSSLFSLNMAYYEIPHYLSWHNSITIADGILQVEKESGVPRGPDVFGYPANWYNLSYTPALDRYIFSTVEKSFLSYAVWHIYNSSGFFLNPAINPPDRSVNLKQLLAQGRIGEFVKEVMTPWWLFLERLSILLGIILAAAGLWRLRRMPLAWAFALIICYLAVLGGPSATSRLRLPIEPILSIYMIVGTLAAIGKIRPSALERVS